MKSNTLILVLIAFIFSSSLFSQEYIPFPEEDGFWKVEHGRGDCFSQEPYGGVCSVSQLYLEGDTLINGTSYKKIYENGVDFTDYPGPPTYWGPGYKGCYRNDIVNKKVFYIRRNHTEELLFYDFNLEIGDTIQTDLTIFFDGENSFIVQSIDSIIISSSGNATYAKRYLLDYWYTNLFLVEGVGLMSGPIGPFGGFFDYSNEVICFQNDTEELSWDNGEYFSCDIISDVNNIPSAKDAILISPNPAYDKIEIFLPKIKYTSQTKVQVYQINGILLKSFKMDDSKISINIEDLSTGVYMINIIDDGVIIARDKFVKL